MGAVMGGGVGLTIGFIFGSYSIMRYVDMSYKSGRVPTLRQARRRTTGIPCYFVAIHAEQRSDFLFLPCYWLCVSFSFVLQNAFI